MLAYREVGFQRTPSSILRFSNTCVENRPLKEEEGEEGKGRKKGRRRRRRMERKRKLSYGRGLEKEKWQVKDRWKRMMKKRRKRG